MSARALALGALATLSAAPGCRSDATGIEAVALELVLESPAAGEGAVLFTLTGSPVLGLEPSGGQVFWAQAGPGMARGLYVGNLGRSVIARLLVPDGRLSGRYGVKVDQVAVADGYRLVSPAEFRIFARR
jgi:hypothetical protein